MSVALAKRISSPISHSKMPEDTKCGSLMVKTATVRACKAAAARGQKQ